MIMILLGVIDLLVGILAGATALGFASKIFLYIAAAYLIIKGLIFIKSLASLIDLLAGIALISSMFFAIPPVVLWIAAIVLIQKAIFSFF